MSLINIVLQNLFNFGHIYIYIYMFKFAWMYLVANMSELVGFKHELVTYMLCVVAYGCLNMVYNRLANLFSGAKWVNAMIQD